MSRRAVLYATRVAFAAFAAFAVVGAGAAPLAACQLQLTEAGPSADGGQLVINTRDGSTPDAGSDGAAADAPIDSPIAVSYQGNPLCNASTAIGGCYPDDSVTPVAACNSSNALGDAGSAVACHVQSAADGPHAICLPAGSGMNGSACIAPTDCAPGLECVGAGVCRPYCCAGESHCSVSDAGAPDSQAGLGGEFCDIQSAMGSPPTKVPVCMPVHTCDLWSQVQGQNACGHGETCAVVREDGTTSCVGVGAAMMGDACDAEHCGPGLVCLGAAGQRRCYTLCPTQDAGYPSAPMTGSCTPGQTCKGGLPLFPDPNVGICQ
jgi:hypothetical protein